LVGCSAGRLVDSLAGWQASWLVVWFVCSLSVCVCVYRKESAVVL
jgi:hypothetical protein